MPGLVPHYFVSNSAFHKKKRSNITHNALTSLCTDE